MSKDRLLSDEELRDGILSIPIDKHKDGSPMYLEDVFPNITASDFADEIIDLINTQKRLYAESEYQTYIYKQDHPRLEAKGTEIWGIRIAYQGQCIYGDITSSKEKAEEKLANELSRLRTEQRKRIK